MGADRLNGDRFGSETRSAGVVDTASISRSRGQGASLGTIPDYAASAQGGAGVVLAGVREGGPAALAGLRRGDRIVAIGNSTIRTVEDLMYVLRQATPGTTVTISAERPSTPKEPTAV